ncbi:MAG: hypothetical protein AAFX44_06085 [Pseudomonadota bacterium]
MTRPDRVLGQVVVDPEATVLDEDDELRPLLVGVVHRLAQRRARRHDRKVLIEPGPDVGKQRQCPYLADPLPFFGRQDHGLALDQS